MYFFSDIHYAWEIRQLHKRNKHLVVSQIKELLNFPSE